MIDPQDINPETGLPYSNYSSPSLDTSFHDHEADCDADAEWPERCTHPSGLHDWPRVEEWERCLCTYCGADGDA